MVVLYDRRPYMQLCPSVSGIVRLKPPHSERYYRGGSSCLGTSHLTAAAVATPSPPPLSPPLPPPPLLPCPRRVLLLRVLGVTDVPAGSAKPTGSLPRRHTKFNPSATPSGSAAVHRPSHG